MTATLTAFRPPRAALPVARGPRQDRPWVIGFAAIGVLFQLGLYLAGNTPARLPLRIGIYGLSLGMLLLYPHRGGRAHPAARLFPAIVLVLILGALIPGGGWLAAAAQATLYVAVLAPLVWMARLRIDRTTFRSLVLVIWIFHAASAAIGALQVYFPGPFDGALTINSTDYFKGAMTITLAGGTHLLRPLGLTDVPGGAGSSGVYAIILGLGLLLTERNRLLQAGVVFSMGVSLFSIYLAQGRTNLVIVAVAAITVLAILVRRGNAQSAVLIALMLTVVSLMATTVAFSVGGDATVDRWATLVADDPRTVAYENRGQFIDQMVQQDIYAYPLGAGGGRWGMMNLYFGDTSQALWAEMMWQALLYDGGVPLILLYVGLLSSLVWVGWKLATRAPDPAIASWAAVLMGFNFATIAASFVFPIYIKDVGLQMMMLNAGLFGVVQTTRRSAGAGVELPAPAANADLAVEA